MDLETLYARFRRSRAFLSALVALVAVWLALHFVFGVDRDFGALNLTLSVEATLGGAILYIALERSEELQKRQLQYIADLSEAIRDLLLAHQKEHASEERNP